MRLCSLLASNGLSAAFSASVRDLSPLSSSRRRSVPSASVTSFAVLNDATSPGACSTPRPAPTVAVRFHTVKGLRMSSSGQITDCCVRCEGPRVQAADSIYARGLCPKEPWAAFVHALRRSRGPGTTAPPLTRMVVTMSVTCFPCDIQWLAADVAMVCIGRIPSAPVVQLQGSFETFLADPQCVQRRGRPHCFQRYFGW
jgi:hypothetical protein